MKKRWVLIMIMLILCGYLFSCSQKEEGKNIESSQSQESHQREPWSLIY